MKIRVNIAILNKQFGDIISPGDVHYSRFERWAEKKDRKAGVVICEFVKEEKKEEAGSPEGGSEENSGAPTEEGNPQEQTAEKKKFACKKCDESFHSTLLLARHVRQAHGTGTKE
jgi:hypothetical protein